MKPVLMIHEVREWMLNLPLQNYILTFDDGLFSQYHYFEHFKKVSTEKYFFISTGIICPENQLQNPDFPTCREAHKKFFDTNDSSNYMNWNQIQEIYKTKDCFIGGHSHNHLRSDNFTLPELYNHLVQDTEKMFSEFEKQAIKITSFCYPYNKKHLLYEPILVKYGIKTFFGDERVPIESLT